MKHIETDYEGKVKISKEFKKFLKESIKVQKDIYKAVPYKATYKATMGFYVLNGYMISISPYAVGYVKIDYRDIVKPNAKENEEYYLYWSDEKFNDILKASKAGDKELLSYLQDNYESGLVSELSEAVGEAVGRTVNRAIKFIEQKWDYNQDFYVPKTKIKNLWSFSVEEYSKEFYLVFKGENDEKELFWMPVNFTFKSSTWIYEYSLKLFGSKTLLELSFNSQKTMSLFFNKNSEIGVIGAISTVV